MPKDEFDPKKHRWPLALKLLVWGGYSERKYRWRWISRDMSRIHGAAGFPRMDREQCFPSWLRWPTVWDFAEPDLRFEVDDQ